MNELTFSAEILRTPKYPNAAFVFVHGDLKKHFGSLKPRVNIWYDAVLYRGTVANMGEGPIAIIPKEVRAKLNKTHGDFVDVRITLDTAERKIYSNHSTFRFLTSSFLLYLRLKIKP
ncbi:MAG: DUF1905 domain-containing protein [Flavobacteriales bacterium]